jgi:hypothetical protein
MCCGLDRDGVKLPPYTAVRFTIVCRASGTVAGCNGRSVRLHNEAVRNVRLYNYVK